MSKEWRAVGWPTVRLADIATLCSGGTPSRRRSDFFAGEIPWLTGQDIPEGRVADISEARDFVTMEAVQGSATRIVPENTVLVTTRVTVGKTGVSARALCFSQDVTGIIFSSPELVLPHFVAYYLLSQRQKLLQRNQGSTIAGITRDSLATEQIPVPPLSEQRRIVEILRAAEHVRHLREATETKLAELMPAIFQQMIGDVVTNPRHWPIRRVSEFVETFEAGKSLPDGGPEVGGGLRVLKISAVTSGHFDAAESKPVPSGYTPADHHFVKPGDFLLSRANTAELVGATALVDQCSPNLLLSDKLWRFVWKMPENISPEFMAVLFRMPGVRQEISRAATGTGGSMKNISMEKLMALRLPLPPTDHQVAFAMAVRDLRQIHRISGDDSPMQILSSSLLAHAFTGQLTAGWRDTNLEALQRDVLVRNEALKMTRATMPPPAMSDQIPIVPTHRTDGAYSELTRDQRTVLEAVELRFSGDGHPRWFTAEEVSRILSGNLRGNFHIVENHLSVLAVRGLVIAVSREEPAPITGELVYGSAYRLPIEAFEPKEGDPGEPTLGDRVRSQEMGRVLTQLQGERTP